MWFTQRGLFNNACECLVHARLLDHEQSKPNSLVPFRLDIINALRTTANKASNVVKYTTDPTHDMWWSRYQRTF